MGRELLDQVLDAGPDIVGAEFHDRMKKIKQQEETPLSVGAELVVYLASDASNGITGRLISAAWEQVGRPCTSTFKTSTLLTFIR